MGLYRESFVFRIGTPEAALIWTGHGDLVLLADAVIPSPETALGGANLINLPDIEDLIGGLSQRAQFTVSGVSARVIALAQEEAPDVAGARVDIGRITFGPDWQQVGPVEWEWSGEAKSLNCSSQSTEQGRNRTITLTVAAGATTRARAPFAYFTDADQRRRSSDDAIFDHVAGINAGTSRRWGPK